VQFGIYIGKALWERHCWVFFVLSVASRLDTLEAYVLRHWEGVSCICGVYTSSLGVEEGTCLAWLGQAVL